MFCCEVYLIYCTGTISCRTGIISLWRWSHILWQHMLLHAFCCTGTNFCCSGIKWSRWHHILVHGASCSLRLLHIRLHRQHTCWRAAHNCDVVMHRCNISCTVARFCCTASLCCTGTEKLSSFGAWGSCGSPVAKGAGKVSWPGGPSLREPSQWVLNWSALGLT